MDYRFFPVPDGRITDAERWHKIARDEAAVIRAGGAVLNHCRAGRNRSALLSALTYRELTGCTGRDARIHLQRVRPNALANQYFCQYLDALGEP